MLLHYRLQRRLGTNPASAWLTDAKILACGAPGETRTPDLLLRSQQLFINQYLSNRHQRRSRFLNVASSQAFRGPVDEQAGKHG